MKVDKETLHKVAHLARLNIDPKDEPKLLNDLSKILDWVDQLKEVDTTGVEPITHMTEEVNVLREDVSTENIFKQEALKNAPNQEKGHFSVPKVLKRND